MIDPWRGCGSEWCWSEVSKKLLYLFSLLECLEGTLGFSFDACHVESKISSLSRLDMFVEPIPSTTTCVFFEFPSRLPSMMSWVIGMNDAVSYFYIPNPAEPN